ncbi:hypothetical protein ACFLZN_00995 [Nanoarchaeota archaeon]
MVDEHLSKEEAERILRQFAGEKEAAQGSAGQNLMGQKNLFPGGRLPRGAIPLFLGLLGSGAFSTEEKKHPTREEELLADFMGPTFVDQLNQISVKDNKGKFYDLYDSSMSSCKRDFPEPLIPLMEDNVAEDVRGYAAGVPKHNFSPLAAAGGLGGGPFGPLFLAAAGQSPFRETSDVFIKSFPKHINTIGLEGFVKETNAPAQVTHGVVEHKGVERKYVVVTYNDGRQELFLRPGDEMPGGETSLFARLSEIDEKMASMGDHSLPFRSINLVRNQERKAIEELEERHSSRTTFIPKEKDGYTPRCGPCYEDLINPDK